MAGVKKTQVICMTIYNELVFKGKILGVFKGGCVICFAVIGGAEAPRREAVQSQADPSQSGDIGLLTHLY